MVALTWLRQSALALGGPAGSAPLAAARVSPCVIDAQGVAQKAKVGELSSLPHIGQASLTCPSSVLSARAPCWCAMTTRSCSSSSTSCCLQVQT